MKPEDIGPLLADVAEIAVILSALVAVVVSWLP